MFHPNICGRNLIQIQTWCTFKTITEPRTSVMWAMHNVLVTIPNPLPGSATSLKKGLHIFSEQLFYRTIVTFCEKCPKTEFITRRRIRCKLFLHKNPTLMFERFWICLLCSLSSSEKLFAKFIYIWRSLFF